MPEHNSEFFSCLLLLLGIKIFGQNLACVIPSDMEKQNFEQFSLMTCIFTARQEFNCFREDIFASCLDESSY